MKITRDVINDLLPLVDANECSPDTRALVDEYRRAHPDDAQEIDNAHAAVRGLRVPESLTKEDEMQSLERTKRMIRLRTYLMAFAIFFSLVPFSVLHTSGRTYWLLLEAPMSAAFYGIGGVLCWIGYAFVRRQTQDL
jgi:hypothetical protein